MDDQEQDPGDLREFLRCSKGDETRAYKLRIVPGGAELWRSTEKAGGKPTLIREDDFNSAEDADEIGSIRFHPRLPIRVYPWAMSFPSMSE